MSAADELGAVTYPPSVAVEPLPEDLKTVWDPSVMKLNVPEEQVADHIAANIKRPLKQMAIYAPNDQHIAIVGGGWSLEETLDELRDLYHAKGVKIVALNGAGRWLYERNLKPSMQIILDARPENAEFVREPIPGCQYFIASQAHPDVFEAVAGRDVTIFHVVAEEDAETKAVLDEHYLGRWSQVPTAGTVGMVAIMMCRLLGFRFQHMFGVDSCYAPDGRHHSFAQPINDGEGAADFEYAGKTFLCSAWQASQALTFVNLIKAWGSQVQLQIHGEGLLAFIIKSLSET